MVSLPTFAAIAPAASAETQSIFPMLYQGSSTQGVSNGNSTPQNETSSSVIGNALSWDSQRQMLAELSSIETTQVEILALPAGSLSALTSTDAYRFQPAGSGFVSVSSKTPNAPAVPVSAASIKDASAQFTVPSSPAMAQSILDMQAVAVLQADLPPVQVTEPKTKSPGEPITATQTSTRNILSWVSFSSSKPLDEAQSPASSQNSSPLSGSPPERQTNKLLSSSISPAGSSLIGRAAISSIVSASPAAGASATGSGLDLTSGLEAATTSSIVSARASQAASVLPAPPIARNAISPGATPKAKRNLPADTEDKTPLFDRTGLPGESFLPLADPAPFQGGTVKAASQPARSAINADTPLLSSGISPAIPPTAIYGRTGLLAGDAAPQSVVDHFSFELTLRPQNPVAANNPAAPTNPGNDAGAASSALPPRPVITRSASVATGSDSELPIALDGGTGQAPVKHSTDSTSGGFADVPAQSASLSGTVASSAQILPTPQAPHAMLKPEASSASISTGPPIVLPETKAPTPQGSVHDVQLRLQGEAGESISVRLSDRSGQVQISVRSSDQATATTLRQDLSTLSAGLEKQGFKTDLSESPLQTAVHDARDSSNQQQSDQQGRQRSVPDWQDPPDRKRQSPSDQWADINEQETT